MSCSEQEFLQKDQQENPNCFYSTSKSTSCTTINGDSKCEAIRRIFRQCPGQAKEEVFVSKQVTENDDEMNASPFGYAGTGEEFDEHFDIGGDMLSSMMQEMFRPFRGFGMQMPFEEFEQTPSRHPVQPPHHRQKFGETAPEDAKKSDFWSRNPFRRSHPEQYNNKKSQSAQEKEELFKNYEGRVDEV